MRLTLLLPPIVCLCAAAALGQTPVISADGIRNGATLARTGSSIAPGSIVSIFGENLAPAAIPADTVPWPTTLGGVSVTFDGQPAALVYVSPQLINVQAPWSLLDRGQNMRMTPVAVTRDGRASAVVNVQVTRYSPGIFTTGGNGAGAAFAINLDDGSLAQPAGSLMGRTARPARIGGIVSIYTNGLGSVTPSVASGHVSPTIFPRNLVTPEVLIAGRPAEVVYSGLSGEAPGVNLVNAVIPAGTRAGSAIPVQLRIGGVTTSDAVTIAVDTTSASAEVLPGPNAADVWSYVTRRNYRQNFKLVPGKTQLYDGIAPHLGLLTIYLNQPALDGIERKQGVMPAGSILIKDNHAADRTPGNTTLMYKIPGFDPPNNDWFWATRTASGAVSGGSVRGCFGCHVRSAANDYLFLASPLPLPATNAAAVREYISKQNYKEAWRLWPGTAEFQQGSAPHGALVSIYVNETAYDAIQARTGKLPAGSFVIKENYRPDRTLAALTVMYKSTGFNPAAGDWYWLQQLPDGSAAAEGRVQGCIGCHNAVAGNDYLYAGSLAARPEPAAAAVWDYAQKEDYRKNWTLWPGTSELMAGNAPHGALITTYVNPAAHDAITRKRGTMPEGAMIIKENFTADRNLAAVTLMYKSEGFDPEHGDWFWLQRLADGAVRAQGKVAGCFNCHAQGAANDYLFLGPLR